jgi:YVTN family beta-propeller protein
VIDNDTLSVTTTLSLGDVGTVAVHLSGSRLYVTSPFENTVSALDATTGTVLATIPVGRGPDPIGQFMGPETTITPPPTPTGTETGTPTVTATATITSPLEPTVSPTPTPSAGICVGDCNEDGKVMMDDIIAGVNIALGSRPLSACPSLDANGDGAVTINELVKAVNNALHGCER